MRGLSREVSVPMPSKLRALRLGLAAALALAGCQPPATTSGGAGATGEAGRPLPARLPLPTGLRLDREGRSAGVGNMPLAAIASPEGDRLVLLLCGWREEGVQVVERSTGRVLQTLPQKAAFLGLAFARDARALYASGGDAEVVYRYAWRQGRAVPDGAIDLRAGSASGKVAEGGREKSDEERDERAGEPRHYPAGIALSPAGDRLYVVENLGDDLAEVDLASGRVVQRLPAGHDPYAVAVASDGAVYVSAWGGSEVSIFAPGAGGRLAAAGRVEVGRHPSALLLNADGSRLFVALASVDRVAVVDTRARRVVAELRDPPPAGPAEGSTPNALALAPGGRRLLVAEADANAVAVFDLAPATAGVAGGGQNGGDRLAGRIPTEWYPTALVASEEGLVVVNGKGRGAGPNPTNRQPGGAKDPASRTYTLGQLNGTLTFPALPGYDLAALTRRVAAADGWDRPHAAERAGLPPFEHVVYIIKENRTYDQVFSDLPQGDGDPSLLFFPRAVSPNHHALAERFGLYDRFLVNAEVSNQGHPWSTSAYSTDFGEKTTSLAYSERYPETPEGEDVNEPAGGYLWNRAAAKGVSFRDYGEYGKAEKQPDGAVVYTSAKPALAPYVCPRYPAWDLDIPDRVRFDAWLEEFQGYVAKGSMPAFELLWLPADHTAGARAGKPTPRAYMADNDLALGRIVEAISASPFWKSTAIFVVEDDAQDGPDHVDSHRSVLLVISPYSRAGVVHRFINTTDVLATIESILGLGALSQFDYYGRPLAGLFAANPDLTPYHALVPDVPRDERNPPGKNARLSARLDLSRPDAADEELFNRVLWRAVKGGGDPPPPARLPLLEVQRAR
jgi:DNA-binding beta-propeller fold protein YncE